MQELETYRVFTAEQDFKYNADTFLQAQTRKWLSRVLQQPLPDHSLATLLRSGRVLGRVADIVLAHVFRRASARVRLQSHDFGERRYSAILDDLNHFQEACKVMGLRQDDLVATSDVITGKNVTATCHALWSLSAACVEQGIKGIPEFVSREEEAQLRRDTMSRSRSSEKARRLSMVMANDNSCCAIKAEGKGSLYLDYIPAFKPTGTDSAYMGSPTGADTDSAFEANSEDAAPPVSPTPSEQSTGCTFPCDLAVATPPRNAAVRPKSAAGIRPRSAAGLRPPPSGSVKRPLSAGAVTTPLGLKLPVPTEVTRQAWAVDCNSYKGLPLRPQPIINPRVVKAAKGSKGRTQGPVGRFLGSCLHVLPAIVAMSAVILIGRTGAHTQDTAPNNSNDQQQVTTVGDEQLWVVGRA